MITNSIYTYDYFQPSEYKFSLDSVFLAQKVGQLIKNEDSLSHWRVLDLCAGCGIIGLELSLHVKELCTIDFLEIQDIYMSYFDKNLDMIYPNPRTKKFEFLHINYQKLTHSKFENTYDLIVSNPPYFFKDEGLLSPSEFKNRCRFFIDSSFEYLIEGIYNSLKPSKSAFILVRSGKQHGRNPIQDIKKILGTRGHSQIIDNVRGTDIIQIRKEVL